MAQAKVHSLTELCGLRIAVETFITPKGPLQYKRSQRFGHVQWYLQLRIPVCCL